MRNRLRCQNHVTVTSCPQHFTASNNSISLPRNKFRNDSVMKRRERKAPIEPEGKTSVPHNSLFDNASAINFVGSTINLTDNSLNVERDNNINHYQRQPQDALLIFLVVAVIMLGYWIIGSCWCCR
ncbi:hypothetical protein K435DRAFT_84610 [Dendrothele bispora CBS 962.96]|uniref:Uncharacterized protein n=1 Tax=Dendrothele bispora (strain CBS 962.96) TaxID=1314807 RepID=A0A4S8KPQ6_DENBC|nr:hypothetical protein K435DRAFT_84610 [Dendrothele bispora CBS 962.96]